MATPLGNCGIYRPIYLTHIGGAERGESSRGRRGAAAVLSGQRPEALGYSTTMRGVPNIGTQ